MAHMTNSEYLEKGFKVRAELRLKNAELFNARKTLDLTLGEAADRIGIIPMTLSNYENLKMYPSKESQEKICEFYRNQGVFLLEEDVFPEKLKEFKGKKYVTEKNTPPEKLIALTDLEHRLLTDGGIEGVEKGINSKKIKDKIEYFLSYLDPRSELCMRLRYGINDSEGKVEKIREEYDVKEGEVMTHEEIGGYIGVCVERSRQILSKAERKVKFMMKVNQEFRELIDLRQEKKRSSTINKV